MHHHRDPCGILPCGTASPVSRLWTQNMLRLLWSQSDWSIGPGLEYYTTPSSKFQNHTQLGLTQDSTLENSAIVLLIVKPHREANKMTQLSDSGCTGHRLKEERTFLATQARDVTSLVITSIVQNKNTSGSWVAVHLWELIRGTSQLVNPTRAPTV